MKNSLFWQFKKEGDQIPSVILGTIHLSGQEAMSHWSKIVSHINDYEYVFTESSLDPRNRALFQNYIFFDTPNVYQDYITENRWNRIRDTFVKYFDLDIDPLKNMRPTFILAALYQHLLGKKGLGLDQRIWNYAQEEAKNVSGLESIEEQVIILRKLSLQYQYRQLVRMSKKISGIRSQFVQILQAYERQDLSTLFRLSTKSIGPDKKILLENRNKVLVDRMINQHNDVPAFFSFGAGHLVGPHGVLVMLKRKGYKIEAV